MSRRRDDRVVPVEAGIAAREVRAQVRAAALLAAQRATRRRGAPAGAGRRAARRSPAASRSRPACAPHRLARRRATGGASGLGRGVAGCGGRARLVERRRARRGGRTRSTREASWRRGGWRRAGRCTRTRRPRRGPATVVRPSRSVTIAAHHVVARRGDGHAARRAGRGRRRAAPRRRWEARRVDAAHVQVDRGVARRGHAAVDRARDRVARRELVDEALAVRRRAASRPRRAPPR